MDSRAHLHGGVATEKTGSRGLDSEQRHSHHRAARSPRLSGVRDETSSYKTKMVATSGPVSDAPEVIRQLLEARNGCGPDKSSPTVILTPTSG